MLLNYELLFIWAFDKSFLYTVGKTHKDKDIHTVTLYTMVYFYKYMLLYPTHVA